MRITSLLGMVVLLTGCQLTSQATPEPVVVEPAPELIEEYVRPVLIQYRHIETTPPNTILSPPDLENYQSPDPNSQYSNPQEAYTYDMLEYQLYVSRYIDSLLEYNKILGIDNEGFVQCLGNRQFPLPNIPEPPTSPDIASYPTRQEGFRAYLEYAKSLNDYAIEMRAEFIEQVTLFNQQCNN